VCIFVFYVYEYIQSSMFYGASSLIVCDSKTTVSSPYLSKQGFIRYKLSLTLVHIHTPTHTNTHEQFNASSPASSIHNEHNRMMTFSLPWAFKVIFDKCCHKL